MTPPLIDTARRLLGGGDRASTQADLRRAISTTYYAAFDALARMCADEMVGTSDLDRSSHEWIRVCRSLNHGRSQPALRELAESDRLDGHLDDFCRTLDALRQRRLNADYDPSPLDLVDSEVALLVDQAETAIAELQFASAVQRRRLAFFSVLNKRAVT